MPLKKIGQRERVFLYPWYLLDTVITGDIKEISKTSVKKAFVYFDNDQVNAFYDDESALELGKTLFEKIKNQAFFEKTKKNILDLSRELLQHCNKAQTMDLASMDNNSLLGIYDEYISRLRKLRVWGWVPALVDGLSINYLSEYLREIFHVHLKELESPDYLEKENELYVTLSSPENSSEVRQEEICRLEMLEKFNPDEIKNDIIGKTDLCKVENSGLKEALQKHLNDFSWLTYAYSGPGMNFEHLRDLIIQNIEKGNPSKQRQEIIKYYEDIKKKKEKLFSELKISKELRYFFEVSSEFMFIKDFRKGVYQKSYLKMDTVFEELAKRLDFSLKEFKYCLPEEIKEALKNKKQRDELKKTVTKRLVFCCYEMTRGKMKIYEGEEAKKNTKEIISKNPQASGQGTLKGSVAYPGKAKGQAKLILVPDDLKKMKPGDILISEATNPDLLVAMKIAGAIITETGGIISHAAIVSRELKIPCIVGVQNATKMIKDGDKLEIDAKKGTINKLL